jgi:hypothetical protein
MVTYIFKYLVFMDDRPGAFLDLLQRRATQIFSLIHAQNV